MKYISIIFLFFSCSCILNTWDNRLTAVNNSDKKILYHWQVNKYYDTIIDSEYCNTMGLYDIPPKIKTQYIITQNKWEFALKDSFVLMFHVFDPDTAKKYGICKMFKERKYLKQYILTYKDLEKINWKIEYNSK